MALKIPPEVERKFGYYRRKIPEAFSKGFGIEVPDNIVDQLAYNLAINRCIDAGVFDSATKTPLKSWTLASMILKELGDMRVHYESRFIEKLERKGHNRRGHDRRSVTTVLNVLRANGWIQIKTREKWEGPLIGRGSCVTLEGTYKSFSLLFELLIEEKGSRVLEERNERLDGQLREARDLGLIKFKLRKRGVGKNELQKYELEYELTDLGKYFKEIMGSCKIDLDED